MRNIDELPQIHVVDHEGFRVVRDDEIQGGTKFRVLVDVLAGIENSEIVYAAHPFGYGAYALALACEIHRKKLTLFYPHVATPPKPMVLAIKHRHVTHHVVRSEDTQAEIFVIATEYAASFEKHLIPIGFDFPEFFNKLVSVVGSIEEDPEEIWAIAGSGCLVRALARAWPHSQVNAVSLGFEQLDAGSAKVYSAPELPDQPAQLPPIFPSAEYYDAKLWRFVREHGQPGALVWNVAS